MMRKGETDDLVLPLSLMPAVQWAMYSHDQLRTIAGLGGAFHVSFDQVAVESVARMHAIDVTPQMARDLHVMQGEALSIMRDAI